MNFWSAESFAAESLFISRDSWEENFYKTFSELRRCFSINF